MPLPELPSPLRRTLSPSGSGNGDDDLGVAEDPLEWTRLARRDAKWMGPVYEAMGLTVGFINQGMSSDERRAAYLCDVTYATANECGFDLLRDQLCLRAADQVHRPFHAAVIDEADSILIDEARIPLVIAGGAVADEHTGGRVGRAIETAEEESRELLERLHLDGPDDPEPGAGSTTDRPEA